jgi:hypothetical protein
MGIATMTGETGLLTGDVDVWFYLNKISFNTGMSAVV